MSAAKGHRTDLAGEGLSQAEVARRLGCSRAYVSQVEKRALQKLARLIEAAEGEDHFPILHGDRHVER